MDKVYCCKCLKLVNYYYDGWSGKLCEQCLVEENNGFPKGMGVHSQCDKCKPIIKWYYRDTYGHILNDCGDHENSDDESLSSFFNY